jgi:hypothetical protein
MIWQEILKKPKFLTRVEREIDNKIPEYKVMDVNPKQGHGGKIDFSETDTQELHEEEPHQLFPPSTPKNADNYIRRLPAKLRFNASGRSKGRRKTFKL